MLLTNDDLCKYDRNKKIFLYWVNFTTFILTFCQEILLKLATIIEISVKNSYSKWQNFFSQSTVGSRLVGIERLVNLANKLLCYYKFFSWQKKASPLLTLVVNYLNLFNLRIFLKVSTFNGKNFKKQVWQWLNFYSLYFMISIVGKPRVLTINCLN